MRGLVDGEVAVKIESRRKGKKMKLSSGYRFMCGEVRTAFLESGGKLSLMDESGNISIYKSWKDFVTEVMGAKPSTGDEIEIISQLESALGTPEPVSDEPREKKTRQQTVKKATATEPAAEGAEPSAKKETTAKTAKKEPKPVAAKPAAAAKEKPVKVIKDKKKAAATPVGECCCGCGEEVARNFKPGHDARVHSWAKKVAAGEMKLSSLKKVTQDYINSHSK